MTIRLSKNTFFHWEAGLGFFRICGYGLHFKNIVLNPLLFHIGHSHFGHLSAIASISLPSTNAT